MKQIKISADRSQVSYNGKTYNSSCIVRTSMSPTWCRRWPHVPGQVHLSTNQDGSDGQPVMPAVFPSGTWNVMDVIDNDLEKRPDLGPMVIRTDANQELNIWALDDKGGYDHETDVLIDDWGYELHFDGYKPDGGFSVGCVHILEEPDLLELAKAVKKALADGEAVQVVAL